MTDRLVAHTGFCRPALGLFCGAECAAEYRAAQERKETRFHEVDLAVLQPNMAAVCGLCCTLIVDDAEGANRRQHEAFHDRIDRIAEQVGGVR